MAMTPECFDPDSDGVVVGSIPSSPSHVTACWMVPNVL